MAKLQKKPTILIISLFLVSLASGINFNIEITNEAQSSEYQIKHSQSTSHLQQINLTAENSGSLGCKFQSEAKFSYGNKSDIVTSPSKSLWPGESALLDLNYAPTNYTGQVGTELYIRFCQQTKKLQSFNYTVKNNITPENSIESSTQSYNPESAKIKIDAEDAILVPDSKPAGWKVSSAKVENGSTTIEYTPSLFQEGENITYTVYNHTSAAPIGTTKVTLETNTTFGELVYQNKWKLLLLVSVIINILILISARKPRKLLKDLKAKT